MSSETDDQSEVSDAVSLFSFKTSIQRETDLRFEDCDSEPEEGIAMLEEEIDLNKKCVNLLHMLQSWGAKGKYWSNFKEFI